MHFPERIFSVNTRQKETPPTRVVFLFGALSICVANRPPAAAFIKKRRETREGFPRKHPLPYGRLRILYSLAKRIRYRHPCAKRILIRGEAGFLRRTHKLHTPRLGRNVLIRMDGDVYFDRKRREYGKKRRIEQIFGGICCCSSPPVMDRVADRLLFFTK